MTNKNILISGGNGYIANHIAKVFKKNNVDYMTSTRTTAFNSNLELDFSKPHIVESTSIHHIDVMIHTVSPNENLYKTDPYAGLNENVSGIRSALEFCLKNNIKQFIYFSSFHVFGKSSGELVETRTPSPYNDYGLAHYTAEETIKMYNRSTDLTTWIIRPSNIFGVPSDLKSFNRWNLIPFAFCKEAVEKGKITLKSPGKQLRNFVSIQDVCGVLCNILQKEPEQVLFHSYGNETISVYDYALLVQEVAFKKFNLNIEVIKPNGKDHSSTFHYKSLYQEIVPNPTYYLEDFVEEMLGLLLEQL